MRQEERPNSTSVRMWEGTLYGLAANEAQP